MATCVQQYSPTLPARGLRLVDADTLNAVRAALTQKGRAPFVGIHAHGRTVLVRRDLFKATLKGLKVVGAELIEDATLAIRVTAVGQRVKATRLFLHQSLREYRNAHLVQAWKRAQWKRAERPKENKYQKQISTLQRRLAKMPLHRPDNPAITQKPSPWYTETERTNNRATRVLHASKWKLQRPTRRAIMQLARTPMPSAQLYARVSKFYPVTIKRWGQVSENERERFGVHTFSEYLSKLWQFCGLADKPEHEYQHPHWGSEHYSHWLETLHNRKLIEQDSATIKAIAADAGVTCA